MALRCDLRELRIALAPPPPHLCERSCAPLLALQRFPPVGRLARMRRNAKVTAGLISVGLVSIYAYSMYAVRQETFLDVLDEEVRQQKKQN